MGIGGPIAGSTLGGLIDDRASLSPLLPTTPASPSPSDLSSGQARSFTLTWTCEFAVTYDVYLGVNTVAPLLVASGLTSPSLAVGPLIRGKRYGWYVVAKNTAGNTTGPIWIFNTVSQPTNAFDYWSVALPWNVDGPSSVSYLGFKYWEAAFPMPQNPDSPPFPSLTVTL